MVAIEHIIHALREHEREMSSPYFVPGLWVGLSRIRRRWQSIPIASMRRSWPRFSRLPVRRCLRAAAGRVDAACHHL